MSEQLDYIRSRIEDAREDKLKRLLAGNFTADTIQFERGYLKALQDIDGFGNDYISAKNHKPETEEEDE